MFDIGFSELLIIAVVALIVLGPERLPKAARFAGLWIRRARSQWQSVKSEFENELADEELSKSLRATRDELDDVRKRLKESGDSVRADFQLDPDRNDSDSDYEEAELGSASDPELKAMLQRDDEPALESDDGAGGRDAAAHENEAPGADEPGPEEPGPDEPAPEAPERREPPPRELPRREPGTPDPARRDPEPRDPPAGPADEPAPDRSSRSSRP